MYYLTNNFHCFFGITPLFVREKSQYCGDWLWAIVSIIVVMNRAVFSIQLISFLLKCVDSVRVNEMQEYGVELDSEIENGSWREQQMIRETLGPSLNGTVEHNDVLCLQTNIWFVWNNRTKSCECGSDVSGIVHCVALTKVLSVLDCNCLTIDYETQGRALPAVGSCIFNCANNTHVDLLYHNAPTDCASLNRQGTLCGQCLEGYAVPAYSYDLNCIKCNSDIQNWGHYILFAFFPLTLFIVITIVFRINVLSPKLNIFVLASQAISIPIFLRIILYTLSQTTEKIVSIPVKIVVALYGIWNLDFLRVNILPDVCINVIPLHILLLDYLVVIYPMLLISVAYTIVQLHNSGFRPVLYVWKPFHRYFARFRRQWGIQTTIMDAFVTFFFLSTTKLFSVSLDLLMGTRIFTRYGKARSLNLYYYPSIKYFGLEHLPYALLAICFLTVFIAFPTSLLLCYQCKAYRRCLVKCKIDGKMMDEFINAFQKYYKDGSNDTWDCRWFSGFFILLKCFACVIYALSTSQMAFMYIMQLCTLGAMVIVMVEPYKEEYKVFNIISANLLLWLTLFYGALMNNYASYLFQIGLSDHYITTVVLGLFPLVYIVGVILHHLKRRFRRERALSSSLPDRLLHSDQYRDSFGFIAAFTDSPH